MTRNFKEKLEKMKYKKIMVTCTNSEERVINKDETQTNKTKKTNIKPAKV